MRKILKIWALIRMNLCNFMKDYEKLREECLQEVLSAGILPGNISSWTINTRAKSRWGLCKKKGDSYEISISDSLLSDERVSEKACKTTIIHEILHTCKDSMKHTGNWKKYAEIMNAKYGYDIKRVSSGSEKGVEDYKVKHRAVKYKYRCRRCGQIITKSRKCKFTRYYRNYGCGICGTLRAFERVK